MTVVVVMSRLRPPFTEGHEQMDRPEKSVYENRKMVWHRFLGEELSQAQKCLLNSLNMV